MKNPITILRAILIIVFVISIASLTLPGNCSASKTYPSIRPIKFIDDPLPKPYTDDGEPGEDPVFNWPYGVSTSNISTTKLAQNGKYHNKDIVISNRHINRAKLLKALIIIYIINQLIISY